MSNQSHGGTFGIELTPEAPSTQIAEWARLAENSGFDTVFVSHHYNNRDEFITLAEIARATDEVQLGPGITNPYETHPVTLASRMATLDERANGRGLFGVGPGDASTLSNLGFEQERPLRRVLETIRVVRRLWAGERVEHDGTFSVADAGLNYDARQLPIYVGAQGPHMTRMSAKYADGILYNGSHPRDIAWARDRIEEGLAERIESHAFGEYPVRRENFDFAVYASVSVAEDETSAREAARPPVAFIVAGAPPPVLERHGLDQRRATRIGEHIAAGSFRDAFDLVTEPMIDAFAVAGTPATVEERLEELLGYADSFVMGSPLGPDVETAIELMGGLFPSNQA